MVFEKARKTRAQVTVTTTPTRLLAENARRAVAMIVVKSGQTIYVGEDNTVTVDGATGGVPMPVGASIEDRETLDAWWAVTESGTADVRVMEASL